MAKPWYPAYSRFTLEVLGEGVVAVGAAVSEAGAVGGTQGGWAAVPPPKKARPESRVTQGHEGRGRDGGRGG